MSGDTAIQIKSLRKKYRGADKEALKGIDLTISKGDFYGVLGPNSAGKTTLISILCGLRSFQSGSITINGKKQFQKNHFPGKHIGLVPQDIALFQNLTVNENIRYFGQMNGLHGTALNRQADSLLSLLHLLPHRNKTIKKCSGGIKRRTNLAAGMIHQPNILILDEPTVGIDAQSRNLIFEYLMELNQSGTTIIYTTHYMGEAEELCTGVSIIDDGIIVSSGSPAALISENKSCKNLGDVFLKITGKKLRD